MGAYLTNGTQMLALNIYNTAVSKNNYSLGQAKAVLFFIILACVSLVQVRISNSKEVEFFIILACVSLVQVRISNSKEVEL